MTAPSLVVREVRAGVRPVRLRLPFRFGASTLSACPQLFVQATVEVQGHRTTEGWAAEMMVPRWFDKRPERSAADNVADLAEALKAAVEAYTHDTPATAFGLSARHHGALTRTARAQGLTGLSAAFGAAVLDRAVIDALCRALGLSFFEAARRNALGLAASGLAPDLDGFDWNAWLAGLHANARIQARHTVGLLDALEDARFGADGLPVSLRAAIQTYGLRWFKIKLGGEPATDLARLRDVLGVLEAVAGDFRFTLDGNEQYDRAALAGLFDGLRGLPALDRLLYIEQPVARDDSLDAGLPAGPAPLLIDEADGSMDAFLLARTAGWRGVSSKGCKGLYKALINRARVERWNAQAGEPHWFMSAEDLTCQAGVAVQQDLALAALLGLAHAERNGHHYADGLAASPLNEQRAFAAAHPGLYETGAGHPRLVIRAGAIDLGSLFAPGFARSAEPELDSLLALDTGTQMIRSA